MPKTRVSRTRPVERPTFYADDQRALTARAIRAARAYRGMSRSDTAERMTSALGDEWTENMVAKLETGAKLVTVEVLAAIAHVQRMPLSWYLYGPSWAARDLNPEPADSKPSLEPKHSPAIAATSCEILSAGHSISRAA